MAKTARLDQLRHKKPAEVPARITDDGTVKGQTIRLSLPAWQQLKLLAIAEGRTQHALIIEALNDFFQKHGKPPIA